jgi:hypothetical protein
MSFIIKHTKFCHYRQPGADRLNTAKIYIECIQTVIVCQNFLYRANIKLFSQPDIDLLNQAIVRGQQVL